VSEYRVSFTLSASLGDDHRAVIHDIKRSLREWGFLNNVDLKHLSVKTRRPPRPNHHQEAPGE
jgi:hypothetical protein